MILNLTELHQFILNILKRFHLISYELTVRPRQHPELNALKSESFSPSLRNRRWQFTFNKIDLTKQMINLMIQNILLFLLLKTLPCLILLLHLLSLKHIKKLINLRHGEVIKADSPDKPIEMFFKLNRLPHNDQWI